MAIAERGPFELTAQGRPGWISGISTLSFHHPCGMLARMICYVPAEIAPGEARAAMTPATAQALVKLGLTVRTVNGVGRASDYADADYARAGVSFADDPAGALAEADLVLRVRKPPLDEVARMKRGAVNLSFLDPFNEPALIAALAAAGVSAVSLEMIPRTTLAQKMDALSSQASLAGYAAVIQAAARLNMALPMMMTPAGTLLPARVFIIGAGVAGLQAIATAKRLGARVEAFDPRPVVKEQVESLGAVFIPMETAADAQTAGGYAKEMDDDFLRREREAIAGRLPKCDVVITTAQVFGKRAPVLITEDMVRLMPQGAVIVDLAAEQGGNCELTRAGEVVDNHGVSVIGAVNLPATLPVNASQMYTKNVVTLFDHLYKDPEKGLNFEDEITRGACLTHAGEIRNDQVRQAVEPDKEA